MNEDVVLKVEKYIEQRRLELGIEKLEYNVKEAEHNYSAATSNYLAGRVKLEKVQEAGLIFYNLETEVRVEREKLDLLK